MEVPLGLNFGVEEVLRISKKCHLYGPGSDVRVFLLFK